MFFISNDVKGTKEEDTKRKQHWTEFYKCTWPPNKVYGVCSTGDTPFSALKLFYQNLKPSFPYGDTKEKHWLGHEGKQYLKGGLK
jgi:hypothetical protein